MEQHRIAFIVNRDGKEKARAWALKTARIYRKAVLTNGKAGKRAHFASRGEYRRKFIESYCYLKRFSESA